MTNLVVYYVPIRYEYSVKKIESTSVAIPYGYNSSLSKSFYKKLQGFNAPSTQSILNNLPQWMEMRKNKDSVGWKLANSWGQNFEFLLENTISSLQDLHLETADRHQKYSFASIRLTNKELISEKTFDNLLYNSSFSIRGPARTGLPAGWNRYVKSDKNRVFHIDSRAFIGSGTILINRVGSIGQSVFVNDQSIKDLSASVYCLARSGAVDVNLLVIVELSDGSTKSFTKKLSSSFSDWIRLENTMAINSKVYRIHFVLHSNSTTPIYLNAQKLEIGGQVTRWSKSDSDSLPYLPATSNFSQVAAIPV